MGDCAPKDFESSYSYTFSNIEVKDVDYPGTETYYNDTSFAVKTNQIGYFLGGRKEASVVLKDKKPVKWKLLNSRDEEVLTGYTKFFGNDPASGDDIHKIDFSACNIAGDDYRIVLESGVC